MTMKEFLCLGFLPLSSFLICSDYIMKLYILVYTTNPSYHPIQKKNKQDWKLYLLDVEKYIQDRNEDMKHVEIVILIICHLLSL